MICILELGMDKDIEGWILADDIHDARRKADTVGERDLAHHLYVREIEPIPGKHELLLGTGRRYLMLVS